MKFTLQCLGIVHAMVFTSAQEPPAVQRSPLRMCSLLSQRKPVLPSWSRHGVAHAPQIASVFPWSELGLGGRGTDLGILVIAKHVEQAWQDGSDRWSP